MLNEITFQIPFLLINFLMKSSGEVVFNYFLSFAAIYFLLSSLNTNKFQLHIRRTFL